MTAEDHSQFGTLHGRPWFAANEALAFVLELVAIGCLVRWGFTVADGVVPSLLLGLGVPAVAVTSWAMFAAPRARIRLPLAGVLAVKAAVLGGATAAVYGVGHPVAAAVLGVVALVNTGCAEFFRNRPATGNVRETSRR